MGAQEDLRIALLGPVQAWRAGREVAIGPGRRQAVLAALVLHGGRPVGNDRLIDGVWGDQPPPTGHRVLPSYVYALRRALDEPGVGQEGSVIRSGLGGYRFAAAVGLDTTRLDELAADTGRLLRSGDASGALAAAEQGLSLFRGEPLAGLPGPYAAGERQRLLIERGALRRGRLDCLIRLGRGSEALADLAQDTDPLDESVLALRIRALYGTGRQGEALATYEGLRQRLREDLGTEPSLALRELHAAVLRHDDTAVLGGPVALEGAGAPDASAAKAADGAGESAAGGGAGANLGVGAAPAHTPASTPAPGPTPEPPPPAHPGLPRTQAGFVTRRAVNELPGNAGGLTGRAAELAVLATPGPGDAVTVATIDGPAGMGKTSLLVHAAWTLRPRFPDGALYLDLRTHHSPGGERPATERLLQRLVRTLGMADADVPEDFDELVAAWRDATSGLRLLLVLDDVGSAAQVRPLLPAGPGSHVLVAGRQRLAGLDADRRVTLEALPAAEARGLLRRLIGEARADADPQAVDDLARLCGGLPLALRIAGARLQHRPSWSPAHLASRMARDERRLTELSAGDRSVEAAFRMSYEQLGETHQRAFRLMGYAPTPQFDVWTPAAMLGMSVDDAETVLEELYDASLVLQPGPGRYRLHDLVRVHARNLADAEPAETARARRAVLELYTEAGELFGDDARVPERGPFWFTDRRDAARWLSEVGADLPDVPEFAAAHGEDALAVRLGLALQDYLMYRDRFDDSRTVLTTALRAAERIGDPLPLGAVKLSLGKLDYLQGWVDRGSAWFRQALDLGHQSGDERTVAFALTGLGVQDVWQGRFDAAAADAEKMIPALERANDAWGVSVALEVRSTSRLLRQDVNGALSDARAALAAAERNGRPMPVAQRLLTLADTYEALGEPGEARAVLLRAEKLLREIGEPLLLAVALTRLGTVADDLAEAVRLHGRALAVHASISPRSEPHRTRLEVDVRRRLGFAYAAAGDRVRARQEFEAALAVPRAAEHPDLYEQLEAALRDHDTVAASRLVPWWTRQVLGEEEQEGKEEKERREGQE
ncbi:winged helix-turn-helix domain-containing protein [Streptomyces sp. NA04227]|uniref:AfsR/SARP family transcriptional regulator n=1 Tax=Streptomyces sp. NA04227 TaxID=2742136 RepID=UPI001592941E|nr:BTAD domain-containing putative transcriptional regulator [Streptomyces sp. NA04227]QKW05824.1 winged helix-turn-helix domain-containing protein [Streptomyces sp. NA04227]